jgi:7,8-dihydropterin-6-yl-methyl-4-(beta-D-ribofuranosyl)aminobenzene 5'-phosphate synthase
MLRLRCIVEDGVAFPALRAEHGLSVLVETDGGNVLCDTGGSGETLLHNLEALGLRRAPIDAVALSHAHLDHTGGLAALLNERPNVPIYAHAEIGRPRFSVREGLYATGLALHIDALAAHAALHLSAEPREILPGVSTTGTIAPRPHPVGGSPHHETLEGGRLVPDPYADDISLVLGAGEGIVLLCGCCHAGLRNTLATVRRTRREPLRAVVGGTHLHDARTEELDAIVEALTREGSPALYLNHCTGARAIAHLAGAYDGRVEPFPAGAAVAF